MRSSWALAALTLVACGGIAVIDDEPHGAGGNGANGASGGDGGSDGGGPGTTTITTSSVGGQGGGPVCGNGVVEPGEECDDGNAVDDDGCSNACEAQVFCGNGVLDPGEHCDDGNVEVNDACPSGPNGTCMPASCGDGFVFTGVEQCDDGNANPFDGCSNHCACSAQSAAAAFSFTGGWGLYTAAPPSQAAPSPIPFPHPAIGTDGNRVPPYPGSETESSFAETPQITLPDVLTFESWHVDEGSFFDTKRIRVSVDGGQSFITLIDCQMAQSGAPFCAPSQDKPGTTWDAVSIPTGFGGQKGIVRIEYDTVDACCQFERGWFIRNANFFPCP